MLFFRVYLEVGGGLRVILTNVLWGKNFVIYDTLKTECRTTVKKFSQK